MDAPPTAEAPPEEPTTAADATAADSTHGDSRPTRRLARSADDRVVAGVAAGIAEYYGFEPLLVRLAFVAASFFGGIGIVAYIVGWIVLPRPTSTGAPARRADVKQLLGFGLVALGLSVIPGSVGFGIGGGVFWPLALIAIGGAVLWLRTNASGDAAGGDTPSATVPPATVPPSTDPPADPPPAGPVGTALATTSPFTSPPAIAAPPPPLPPTPPAAPAAVAARPARPPRPKSYLAAITASALLVLVGGAWLVDLAGIVDVDVTIVVALALAVVGIALVASAWYGRARGLIALGITLALVVAAFGVLDVPLRGGIGETTYRPRAVTAVKSSYDLAIGKMVVDLRAVDFSGEQRAVHTAVGIGDLDVLVPDGVRVVVDGHSGAGSVTVFGRRSETCCPTDIRRVRPGVAGGGRLHLDAEVGAGTVEIKREIER